MLFPTPSPARETLEAGPERILVVSEVDRMDTIPWEYIHHQDDFLALEFTFPSNLISDQIKAINITAIEQFIAEQMPPEHKPAFEQRLDWLRQIAVEQE